MAPLDEELIKAYKDSFDAFDKDGNGHITLEELRLLIRNVGRHDITDVQLEQMIKSVDQDHNNTIDFDEFIALMQRNMPNHPDEELYAAFRMFDKNGNGTIDTSELATVMENIGERLTDSEVQLMIKEADLNGDNVINFEEFKKMVSGQRSSQ